MGVVKVVAALCVMLQMKELYTEGTLHQKMRCWAPGMEGWKPLDQIAQLKWMVVSGGNALLNESELAALILNMFIRICSSDPTRSVPGGGVEGAWLSNPPQG